MKYYVIGVQEDNSAMVLNLSGHDTYSEALRVSRWQKIGGFDDKNWLIVERIGPDIFQNIPATYKATQSLYLDQVWNSFIEEFNSPKKSS